MVMLIWFSFAAPTILDNTYPAEVDNAIQADWWDDSYLVTAWGDTSDVNNIDIENNNQATVTRTVISAVPKTGPSWSLVWVIIATLAIFGWYIYIKKRADI